uniref:Uncharacterized protein n=1 Tax=Ciona intestinalis TaxID=7719 RepID=H2XSE1_CIOIN
MLCCQDWELIVKLLYFTTDYYYAENLLFFTVFLFSAVYHFWLNNKHANKFIRIAILLPHISGVFSFIVVLFYKFQFVLDHQ